MSKETSTGPNQITAKRIAQLLFEKSWNKSQLAREMGLSVQAVQQWTKGTSRPRGSSLEKLVAVSGKPEYWFFTDDDHLPTDENIQRAQSVQSDLNEEQRRILEIFNQFPPAERRNMLAAFEMRLLELQDFYARVVKGQK